VQDAGAGDVTENSDADSGAQQDAPADAPYGDDPDVPGPSEACDMANPQGNTIGLLRCEEGVEPGYILFSPNGSTHTWLMTRAGRVAHRWDHRSRPGLNLYLLDDGRLLRTRNTGMGPFQGGGAGGGLDLIEWDGTVTWSWEFADDSGRLHHDVEPMPDGSFMVIAWEYRSGQEAVDAGRDPNRIGEENAVWAEQLLQIRPAGDDGVEIVWEWHVWDHLVQNYDSELPNYAEPLDNPDKIDLNYGGQGADWLHINAVFYNEDLDQLAVSVHNFSEIWVIDRQTGSIVYRWGNPAAYGAQGPQHLFLQHDVRWIPQGHPGAGHLMAFSNGDRQTQRSAVVEWEPPVRDGGSYALVDGVYGPQEPVWTYQADGFYSSNISGAYRLPGGNTLVCEGAEGRFFEVTQEGERIWEYLNPDHGTGISAQGEDPPRSQRGQGFANAVFRVTWIPEDHPGLSGRELTPGAPIEETQ